jgi:release factor glutamine methyltransferase
VTIGEWLSQAQRKLTAAGISNSRLDSLLILEHATKRPRENLLSHTEADITDDQLAKAQQLLDRRSQREPLVHLTGTREFYGLDLKITPDVLTPRVETEAMAELAIKYTSAGSKLLDMGTGSGALAIAIAKHRPDLNITASEVSPAALAVAEANAKHYHLNINFVQSNLWQAITGRFSTVVTNLPYLSDESMDQLMPEVKYEPSMALMGGGDGLDLYRHFFRGLPDHLEPGGYLFIESDPWQHQSLLREASTAGLKPIEQGYFILGFSRP